VSAHGASTREDDVIEALGIRECLDNVPVTALKSYFGHLGAGGGAVEFAGSLLAIAKGEIPCTLNYQYPDPECPVNVIHDEPLRTEKIIAMVLNQSTMGHAVAMIIAGP
jgi:3-oxoacyl-[acyl-carrier-protein] synthase II